MCSDHFPTDALPSNRWPNASGTGSAGRDGASSTQSMPRCARSTPMPPGNAGCAPTMTVPSLSANGLSAILEGRPPRLRVRPRRLPRPRHWRRGCNHTVAFNHADPGAGGQTVPWNLACYCREHHRLKTFHGGVGGWRDQQLPDGTIVWTSPTGRIYRTTPGGPELFPQMRRVWRPNHASAAAPRTRRCGLPGPAARFETSAR